MNGNDELENGPGTRGTGVGRPSLDVSHDVVCRVTDDNDKRDGRLSTVRAVDHLQIKGSLRVSEGPKGYN